MNQANTGSLSGLTGGGSDGQHAAGAIPMPGRKWGSRVILPAAVLLSMVGLLAYAARDALVEGVEVKVARVIARPRMNGAAGGAAKPATDPHAGHKMQAGASGKAAAGPAIMAGGGAGMGTIVTQAPGWVEPDPYPLHASALANGVVKEVLVLEGERVKAGQTVATLVDDESKLALERAQADLAVREAEVQVAQAVLEGAKTEWENPVTRRRATAVAQANLAQADAELRQTLSMIDQEKARLRELEVIHQRTVALVPDSAASGQEVVEALSRYEGQKAAVATATAKRSVVEAQIQKAKAELEGAEQDQKLRIAEKQALAEAEAKLAQARAAARQAAAARDEAALRLSRMTVISPFDGLVMTRQAAPGTKLMLEMDDPLSMHVVHLYDPTKLQVRADIPLADAAKVGVGQRATIIVDVLPDKVFTGRVTRVVNQADIQKNTLQVKVAIDDPSLQIKPEMLARVKFLATTIGDGSMPMEGAPPMANAAAAMTPGTLALFVPQSALHDRKGHMANLWVVDGASSKLSLVQVHLPGEAMQGWLAVVGGVNAGQSVVVEAKGALKEGAKAKVIGEMAQ